MIKQNITTKDTPVEFNKTAEAEMNFDVARVTGAKNDKRKNVRKEGK